MIINKIPQIPTLLAQAIYIIPALQDTINTIAATPKNRYR